MTRNLVISSTWTDLGDALHPLGVLAVIVVVVLAGVVFALARSALGAGTEFEGEIRGRFFGMRIRIDAAPDESGISSANADVAAASPPSKADPTSDTVGGGS